MNPTLAARIIAIELDPEVEEGEYVKLCEKGDRIWWFTDCTGFYIESPLYHKSAKALDAAKKIFKERYNHFETLMIVAKSESEKNGEWFDYGGVSNEAILVARVLKELKK